MYYYIIVFDKMKIRKIKFNDDFLFGSLELNFLKSDETPYENVVLVGENGVGKTTLLNLLKQFVGGPERCYFYDFVEYEINGGVYQFERMPEKVNGIAQFNFHDLTNKKAWLLDGFENEDYPDEGNPYIQNSIFSFSQNDKVYENEHNFEKVIERLKSIQEEDCINYVFENIKHPEKNIAWTDFFETSKMSSFAKAFNSFFEDMKYFGLGFNNQKEKVIGFSKFGKEFPIDSLSSGEKQIIERAVPFLEQMDDTKDNLCLIDEPEISLHPKWQSKVYYFYKNLFRDKTNKQRNQIIMASHSSAILKEALSNPNDTLVFRLINENGTIHAERIEHASFIDHITYAEVNYLVFGIPTPEYHNQLYCEIQNRFNKHKVKACDDFIASQPIYDVNLHEKVSGYGITNYSTLSTYIRNAIDHYNNGNDFTEDELETSIKLMQEILR